MLILQCNEHADCSKELILTNTKYSTTALIDTVHSKNADCLKKLLKAGAEFNLTNNACDTAFIPAYLHGHLDCVNRQWLDSLE